MTALMEAGAVMQKLIQCAAGCKKNRNTALLLRIKCLFLSGMSPVKAGKAALFFMMIFTKMIKCSGESILPVNSRIFQVHDAGPRPAGLLGKNHALYYGEYEGNNLFSDIEL